MSKKEKIKRKSNYEVLLSSDASEAQGFFYEGGDDHALVVFRDEEDELEQMPETGIPWSVLGDAMGTNEQLQPRRSARVAREVDEEEWESESDDPDYQDDIDYEDEEDEEAILNSTTFAE